MAVSDLITSIRYQLHDTDTNNYTGAEILDYINRGYRLIWSQLVKKKSDFVKKLNAQALVSGTENYALPSDFLNVALMQIETEEDPLAAVDIGYIETYTAKFGTGDATPKVYAIHNGYFYLRPIPDAVYTLNEYYFYKTTDLNSSSDTPFNSIADEALISFAVGMCLNRDEKNVQRNDSVVSSLLKMADTLFQRRDKTLKRINAYRWEYQGML
jgi:hypothetical protein